MSIKIDAPVTPPATGEDAPGGDRADWFRANWQLCVVVVLAAMAALPVFVAGLEGATHVWFPADDWAVMGFGALDVGTAHTPLVGVYSRYGWHHPGPFVLWVYGAAYRLFGGSFSGLMVAAGLINAGSVVGMIVFAWRRGRLVLAAIVSVTLAVLVHTMGTAILRDPWNPWVTILPFGLLVLTAWAAGEGDRAAVVPLALVSSFLVQTHVGFALPVVVLVAAGLIGLARRDDSRVLIRAAVVTVVCWVPVFVHVLTGGDNLARLFRYFVSGSEETAGLGYALEVVQLELGGRAPWLGAPEPGNAVGGGLLPGTAGALAISVIPFVVVVIGLLATRRRAVPELRLLGFVGLTALLGLVAVSRVSGPMFSYLVRWWWPIAALWWAAVAWGAWALVTGFLGVGVRRRAEAVVGVVGVGVVILLTVQTLAAPAPLLDSIDENRAQRPLAAFSERAVPLVPVDRPVLFRWIGPRVRWVGDGFALELERTGRDVRVDDDDTNELKFGSHRVVTDPDDSMRAAWVVTGLWVEDFARAFPGRELARWDPLSAAERAEASEGLRRLRTLFRDAGREDLVKVIDDGGSLWPAKDFPGTDQAELDRLEALQQRGQPAAVFLFDRADEASLPER